MAVPRPRADSRARLCCRDRLDLSPIDSRFGTSERDDDSREALATDGPLSWAKYLRMDAHQLLEPIHFDSSDSDATLPLRTALQIVDGDALAADDETSPIRLAEPIVQTRDGHPQPPRRLPSC